MSSPRLGVVRESMLTNPLHIKAPLGQSRSRGLTVPGPDFTFGTSSSSLKDGGVAEVLSSWKVPSRPEGSATRLDFVSLNRDAIRSGLVTSKEISQYRAQRGGASTQSPAPRRSEGGASRRPAPIPDITYGVQNRPSSPLSDLITHQYGRSWLDEQLNRKQNIITHQVKPGGAAETRTSLLRRSRALPVTHSPVQLSHFTQVSPALDTFRDPAARLRTFRLSGGTGGPAERQGTDRTERRTAVQMEMEVSASGCFCIDSLLSLRPPAALLSRPRPPELSGGSELLSPRGESAARLEAPLQPRSVSSSFLIRDILADCRSRSDPGQVCSDPGQPELEVEPFRSGAEESQSSASSDSDTRARAGQSADGVDVTSCPPVNHSASFGSDPVRLKKPRKARTAFSDQQLSRLERSFQNQKYLNVQNRMELAAELQLSDAQVKTWYQNRRTKWKRQAAAGLDLLAEAGRMFLPPHFLYPPAPPTLDLYLYRGHAHHHTTPSLLPRLLSHTDPH